MASSRRRAPAAPQAPITEATIDTLEHDVRRDGAAAKTTLLATAGIPTVSRPGVLEALAARGLELTSRFVRVPLPDQLVARVAAAGITPLKGIEHAVTGGTRREVLDAVAELVAGGRLHQAQRGGDLVLVASGRELLDQVDLDRLEDAVESLARLIKLARKKGAAPLRPDVDAILLPLVPALRQPARGGGDALRSTIHAHRQPTGLIFVPAVVRALGGLQARTAVHAELLGAVRAGWLELRPESGMGRLSREDAELCVPGPQGTTLSWARCIEEST